MVGIREMHTDLMWHIIPEAEGLLRVMDEFYSFGFLFVFVFNVHMYRKCQKPSINKHKILLFLSCPSGG